MRLRSGLFAACVNTVCAHTPKMLALEVYHSGKEKRLEVERPHRI